MTTNPDDLLEDAIAEVEADLEQNAALDRDSAYVSTDDSDDESMAIVSAMAKAIVTGGYSLSIDEDRMQATITFPPLKGEPAPEPVAIVEDLKKVHRLRGIDTDALSVALVEASSRADEPSEAVIARGTEPADGRDGELEWLGDFFESRSIVHADGRIDHYQHTKLSVHEGQRLVRIHEPDKGEPGCDVCGRTIKPNPGQPASLDYDDTITPDENDANVLLAALPGMVEFYRGKLTVSDVMIVDAVDFSTGSIEFDGAVRVHDGVDPKFTVSGVGSVIIGGTVDGARIESKKSITIDQGVMGHGDAVVDCAGDVMIGFARETAIRCGGKLSARSELLWCEGEVFGDLLVYEGRVVGGHWRVGGRAVIDNLGSREETETTLTLGNAPEANRALQQLTRDRKRCQERLAEFRRKYAPFLAGEAGNLDPKERQALDQRRAQLERDASRTRKREYILRKRMNIQSQHSYVWVKSMIHPGVRLRLNGGKHTHVFKEPQPGPVCVRYDSATQEAMVLHCALGDAEVGMN